MLILLAAERPNTISGALIALILAIAAAIPLLLRLYFKDRRRQQRNDKYVAKKRLMTEQQKVAIQKKEAQQRMALEKKEAQQRMALEKKEVNQRLALEKKEAKCQMQPNSGNAGKTALKVATTVLNPVAGVAMIAADKKQNSEQETTQVEDRASKHIEQVADIELFRQKH